MLLVHNTTFPADIYTSRPGSSGATKAQQCQYRIIVQHYKQAFAEQPNTLLQPNAKLLQNGDKFHQW